MTTTPAGHRVIGIRHTLKKLKRKGLIDEDVLYPADAAASVEERLLAKARSWYRIGAVRGALVALDAILAGHIAVEDSPKGKLLTSKRAKLLWPKQNIKVVVGNRKINVALDDFVLRIVEDLKFAK